MQTLDERVAFLEGRVDEHSRGVDDMRALVVQLDGKVDRHLEAIHRRFDALEAQIAALDQKMSRQFLWLMGALTTVLVTMIGSLAGVVLTLG